MQTIWKILRALVFLFILLVLAAQLIRPSRANPPVDESQTIQTQTQMPPQVSAILDRSCRDCHSNKTIWPWYTNVAPVSWFIINHVNDGRHSMNLSEWGKLDHDKQDRKLRQICDEIQDGVMPLSTYTPLHPGSKLSEQDKKTLCDWTDAERQRLSAATSQ
jgi:hypothetical protein